MSKLNWAAKSLFVFALGFATCASAAPSLNDLESAFAKNQWNEAAQIAFEIINENPKSAIAKIKGAYALFQRGFPYSALLFLKKLSPEDWKSLPQGQDRLAEVVTLFNKKISVNLLPGRLDMIDAARLSPFLKDEIRFARGRQAIEKGKLTDAEALLKTVSKSSRFYNQARYLIATIAIGRKDYATASAELSKVFELTVFEQTSEFWKDMQTQVASHWGTSFKVLLDTELLTRDSKMGEMSTLAFARIAYAKKEYPIALGQYNKFAKESTFYGRVLLEKIWTLLALNRHEEAQQIAVQLSEEEGKFESLEGRPLRSLIMADAGRPIEARGEIERFAKIYDESKEGLQRYLKYRTPESLPSFLQNDLAQDAKIQGLREYQDGIRKELEALKDEDRNIFRVYSQAIEVLMAQSDEVEREMVKLISGHATRRLADLERLFMQTRLILAESYLEERENLRKEFLAGGIPSESKQRDHDERLVQLLDKAVNEVDGVLKLSKLRNLRLEFRQSELLWELSSARIMLSQSTGSKKESDLGDATKRRSAAIAEEIAVRFPNFSNHPQAVFFTGFAKMELGKIAEGAEYLEKYAKLYPNHTFAPDAHRILGDHYFDKNDMAKSEYHYKQVLRFSESPVVGYALYKIGWCAYNLKAYDRAFQAMERAIGWARQTEKTQALNLDREATRDLISIYAEVGDHKRATNYFRMVFKDSYFVALSEYASQLDSQGQYEKSAEIYKTLQGIRPSAEENLAFQAAVIRGVYKLRRWDVVIKETQELVDRYGKKLAEPTEKDTPAFIAEQTVREASMAQHFEFRKPAGEDFNRLRKLDEIYLKAFADWPKTQEVQYEYAHMMLEAKQTLLAMEAFKTNWARFKGTMKEPLREESLRNLLNSLEKAELERKDPGKDVTELSPIANDIADYSGEYDKLYPKTKYSRTIKFMRSVNLFKYNRLKEGIEESYEIMQANATDDFAKKAFNNMRSAYYKDKDWKGAKEWSTSMLKRGGMETYKKDLITVKGESSFFLAEQNKDDVDAAGMFMEIADDPDQERLHDRALYNAFIRLEKSGKKEEALKVGARLDKSKKSFDGLSQAQGLRSALYQEAGDYARALPLLKNFLANPGPGVAPEALAQGKKNVALITEAIAQKGPKNRAPASVPVEWPALVKKRDAYLKQAVPPKGDLAGRIQKGGMNLEQVGKALVDFSAKPGSDLYAFEAYCSLPFLYVEYGKGIVQMGKKLPPEVQTELAKIAIPLEEKAKQVAEECLTKSADAEHDGPLYRKVNATWGWEKDPALRTAVAGIQKALEAQAPWMDPVPVPNNEQEILAMHIQGKVSADTWYSLGVVRHKTGKYGLSRLTFADALSKDPSSGRLLNSLAGLELTNPQMKGLAPLFEKAADAGSPYAYLNLGTYHLRGRRLKQALAALDKARPVITDKELLDKISGLLK